MGKIFHSILFTDLKSEVKHYVIECLFGVLRARAIVPSLKSEIISKHIVIILILGYRLDSPTIPTTYASKHKNVQIIFQLVFGL